jgi:CRP-like cAMP-binding protein
MENNEHGPAYHIWGLDNAAYGPVELPVLLAWIKDERVTANTWLYLERSGEWTKASALPELRMYFPTATKQVESSAAAATSPQQAEPAIRPGALRRIKMLAMMDDSELRTLIKHVEVQEFKAFAPVVRSGEHGDSMYLILSGELRARILVDGVESTLSTLEVGDYFGEISLLDEGPRSADVLANADAVVLKLSSAAFQKLMREAPEAALHFMYALGRSAAGKIRAMTKRYEDSVRFSRFAPGR